MEDEKVSPGGPSTNQGPLLGSIGYCNLGMLPASWYLACLESAGSRWMLRKHNTNHSRIQISKDARVMEEMGRP